MRGPIASAVPVASRSDADGGGAPITNFLHGTVGQTIRMVANGDREILHSEETLRLMTVALLSDHAIGESYLRPVDY